MEFIKIVGLSVLAAVVYGVLHDQVTVRVCREYFTIGHDNRFGTENPTLLALGWGVIATWWVGLALGILVSLCARVGGWERTSARDLVRVYVVLFASMFIVAAAAGTVAWWLAVSDQIELQGSLAARVPIEKHDWFLAAGGAHLASYASGIVGGVMVAAFVLTRRWRKSVLSRLERVHD